MPGADEPPLLAAEIRTRDEAEAAMAIITSLQLQLNVVVDQQNAELQVARKHDADILELKDRINKYTSRLETWATANRQVFGQAKSLELRQGTIGFRLGNRAVKLLEGWDEARVLAKLRELGKKFVERYIRNNPELNKQQVLSDARPEVALLSSKDLTRLGLSIERKEKFFAEPKLEVLKADP